MKRTTALKLLKLDLIEKIAHDICEEFAATPPASVAAVTAEGLKLRLCELVNAARSQDLEKIPALWGADQGNEDDAEDYVDWTIRILTENPQIEPDPEIHPAGLMIVPDHKS